MSSISFSEILSKAADKRKHLQMETNAYRICNGKADGLSGVTVDKYNEHYQIQFFAEDFLQRKQEVVDAVNELFEPKFLVVKNRIKSAGQSAQNFDFLTFGASSSETLVTENSLKFSVDLADALNPGLFLDMRAARLAFAKHCKDKDVLNLFAYTCSFSVYARAFGAKKTINVDISKKSLNKGKENFLLNNIELQNGEFFCGSSEEYVDWCIKKGKKFGAIAADPPSFAKNGKYNWSVAKNFEGFIAKLSQILAPDGILLASTNYSEWNSDILRSNVKTAFACNQKYIKILQEGMQGEDFPGTGTAKESSMHWGIFRNC